MDTIFFGCLIGWLGISGKHSVCFTMDKAINRTIKILRPMHWTIVFVYTESCYHQWKSMVVNGSHWKTMVVIGSQCVLPCNAYPWCNHPALYSYLAHPISAPPVNEPGTLSTPVIISSPRTVIEQRNDTGSGEVEVSFSNRSVQINSQWVPNSWSFLGWVYQVFFFFPSVWVFQCSYPSNKFLLNLLIQTQFLLLITKESQSM